MSQSRSADMLIDTATLDRATVTCADEPPLQFVASYSGVRGHFGECAQISDEAKVVALAYAYSYVENVIERWRRTGRKQNRFRFVLGRDPRPTSPALLHLQQIGFKLAGDDAAIETELIDLGVTTTPALQSAVRTLGADGGAMVTGSHNPVSDNGIKYLTGKHEPECNSTNDRGGVLNGSKMGTVIGAARQRLRQIGAGRLQLAERANAYRGPTAPVRSELEGYRQETRNIFRLSEQDVREIRATNRKMERRIVVDTNGGGASEIVPAILDDFIEVVAINTRPGRFVHRIEPVADGLADAIRTVDASGADFGVVLDADGDRGNLVATNVAGNVGALHPQDVAKLNVAGMLAWVMSHPDRYPEVGGSQLAVVAHGATSGRVDAVASIFGAQTVGVETGEVNVVRRMSELNRQGFFAPIGVEGSNGGAVFFGSQVRDGTLTGLLAILMLANSALAGELRRRFELQIGSGSPLLPSILAASPAFSTIQSDLKAGTGEASQGVIKQAFEEFFIAAKQRAGDHFSLKGLGGLEFATHEFLNYEETELLRGRNSRKTNTGGFKVLLTDTSGRQHFIWFRMSKTETGVIRIVVDSPDPEVARYLLALQETLYMQSIVKADQRPAT